MVTLNGRGARIVEDETLVAWRMSQIERKDHFSHYFQMTICGLQSVPIFPCPLLLHPRGLKLVVLYIVAQQIIPITVHGL